MDKVLGWLFEQGNWRKVPVPLAILVAIVAAAILHGPDGMRAALGFDQMALDAGPVIRWILGGAVSFVVIFGGAFLVAGSSAERKKRDAIADAGIKLIVAQLEQEAAADAAKAAIAKYLQGLSEDERAILRPFMVPGSGKFRTIDVSRGAGAPLWRVGILKPNSGVTRLERAEVVLDDFARAYLAAYPILLAAV